MKNTHKNPKSQPIITLNNPNVTFYGLLKSCFDFSDTEIFAFLSIAYDCLNGSAKGYLGKKGYIAKSYKEWTIRCKNKFSERSTRRYFNHFAEVGIIIKQSLDADKHRVLKGKYPNNTIVISLNMEKLAEYGIDEAYLNHYFKYDGRYIKFTPVAPNTKNKFGQTLIYPLFYRYKNLTVYNTSPMIIRRKHAEKHKILPIEEQFLCSDQIKYGLDMEIPRHRLERSFEKMKAWYIRCGYTRLNLARCDHRWKKWLSHEFLPKEQKNAQEAKMYQRKVAAKIIQLKDYQPTTDDLTSQLKKLVMETLPKQLWVEIIPAIVDVTMPKSGKLCIRMKKHYNVGINGTVKAIARRIWPEVGYIDVSS